MTTRTRRAAARRADRGFTLVEILISIVLVGILSAVVVVGVSNLTDRGSAAACSASADAARTAAAVHLTSSGAQATTLSSMIAANELTLPTGVAVGGTGLVATGSGWTLTMTAGANGGTPTFACATSSGSSGTSVTIASSSVGSTPPVTAGLIASLDAGSVAGLFQDGAGSTAVAAAGQRVCRWADASGVGNHAVQATTAKCPLYGSDATGGYLDFNANGFLRITPTLSPDFTIFVVAQSDTPTWNTYGWLAAARGASGLIIHTWPGGTSVGDYVIAGGTTYHNEVNVAPANIMVPHVYMLSAAHSAPVGYGGVDGIDTAYTEPASGRAAGTVPITFGADDYDSAGRAGNGKYRQVLLYNRALGSAELVSVESYLRARWGTP
jgi:type IV pilus assembly protein PilA